MAWSQWSQCQAMATRLIGAETPGDQKSWGRTSCSFPGPLAPPISGFCLESPWPLLEANYVPQLQQWGLI